MRIRIDHNYCKIEETQNEISILNTELIICFYEVFDLKGNLLVSDILEFGEQIILELPKKVLIVVTNTFQYRVVLRQ